MEHNISRTDARPIIGANFLNDNWFILLVFLGLLFKSGHTKFSLQGITTQSLDKKCRLLNRIKGYMDAREQHIVHRAEMILEIVGKTKLLMDGPGIANAGVRYTSLSIEEKRRNMIMDLSEFIQEDKREVLYKAVELDKHVEKIGKTFNEINTLSSEGIKIDNIEKYINLIEPLLDEEMRDKAKEIRKLAGILKVLKSMEQKGRLDEIDILEAFKPFVDNKQAESLIKITQIMKAVSNMEQNQLNKNENVIQQSQKEESEKGESGN